MRLKDKVAVITGGTSGIGLATVRRFLEEGAKVVYCARRERDVINELKKETDSKNMGNRLRFFKCDVSDEKDVSALAEYVKKEFGNCEILVNNAGVHFDGKLLETTPDNWDMVMNTDLRGTYLMCYYFLPQMIENNCGSIINISSVSGIFADYGACAYNAAKGGVVNLTRSIAVDYAGNNIRANGICPGITNTEMATVLFDNVAGTEDAFKRAVPSHAVAEPVEIANACVFLASRESDSITGVNLPVDGGLTACTHQPNVAEYVNMQSK